ncbi:MAG: ribonuclease HII [Candidatus Bathyarchaeota archaeon]|nr:MAG: ribonuclease HII [Candidatus Bathyarchaeota archaeon]
MKVAGIDDAGRGAIIGPLVIGGILIADKNIPNLVDIGVKDSKRLGTSRREYLSGEIKKLAVEWHVVELSPKEIDNVVETGRKLHKLNRLEAQTMAKVIEALKPDVVYVDASDVVADRFGRHIAERLSFEVEIVSEHKADEKYPVVSAASIIAKVERDEAISRLRQEYGNFGSGYPADSKTLHFLEEWIGKFEYYPDFVRKSWKPAKRLKSKAKSAQTRLL